MIRCRCGDERCHSSIAIERWQYGVAVWITDESGTAASVYLDANGIVQLVAELREALFRMVGLGPREGG